MLYRTMGLLHAWAWSAGSALREQRGQGTVEYVGLMLMLGVLLATVVGAAKGHGTGIAGTIVSKLKEAISQVGANVPK